MLKKLVGVAMLAMLAAAGAFAQEAAPADASRAADHEALRALRARIVESLNKRDMAALNSCFAKEFVFTAVDQTVVTNEAQLKAFDAALFGGDQSLLKSLQVNPEATILTKFVGDNVGYCYGTSNDTYTMKDGTAIPVTSHWTATVVKEDGAWKVAAGHAGVNLLANPVLARTASFGMKLGAGGLCIGLVLGLLLGWFLGRAKRA